LIVKGLADADLLEASLRIETQPQLAGTLVAIDPIVQRAGPQHHPQRRPVGPLDATGRGEQRVGQALRRLRKDRPAFRFGQRVWKAGGSGNALPPADRDRFAHRQTGQRRPADNIDVVEGRSNPLADELVKKMLGPSNRFDVVRGVLAPQQPDADDRVLRIDRHLQVIDAAITGHGFGSGQRFDHRPQQVPRSVPNERAALGRIEGHLHRLGPEPGGPHRRGNAHRRGIGLPPFTSLLSGSLQGADQTDQHQPANAQHRHRTHASQRAGSRGRRLCGNVDHG